MIVRNVYMDKLSIVLDSTIRTLIANKISYVLIKNENYVELHFDNYIYNIYFDKPLIKINDIELLMIDAFNTINKKYFESNMVFTDNYKLKKERPGFKRYTKKKYES